MTAVSVSRIRKDFLERVNGVTGSGCECYLFGSRKTFVKVQVFTTAMTKQILHGVRKLARLQGSYKSILLTPKHVHITACFKVRHSTVNNAITWGSSVQSTEITTRTYSFYNITSEHFRSAMDHTQ